MVVRGAPNTTIDLIALITRTTWITKMTANPGSCNSYHKVAEAIKSMVVRGGPAIGITAAYGLAIAQVL